MRRRDRQSEVLVALIVTAAMAFVLAFSILLSLGGRDDENNHTATAIDSAMTLTQQIAVVPTTTLSLSPFQVPNLTQTETAPALIAATASPTAVEKTEITPPTKTEVPPEITPTQTPTSTHTVETPFAVTEEITEEAQSPTETNTPRPPTATRSATPTIEPSATRTKTLIPPSATPTNTPRPPSPTPSLTNTASRTPSLTNTPTPRPPSPTPTMPRTPTRTNTPRPLTATPAPTITTVPLPLATVCAPVQNWAVYIVQGNDTLFSIALRYNIQLQDLASANCITNTALIFVGQRLLVPPGVVPTTTGFGSSDSNVEFCDNPSVVLTAPQPGATVDGIIVLSGIAEAVDFQRYIISWRPDLPGEPFIVYEEVYHSNAGDLSRFDTDAFSPGAYWFSLRVVNSNNEILGQCAIRVLFQ